MVYYTYLDFLRHVKPYDISRDIDFCVFGTFDALYVKVADSIASMKKYHEDRHKSVPWQSERQPMFLASLEEKNEIFDNSDTQYKNCPLLISVIQVDKSNLMKTSFFSLLNTVNKYINERLTESVERGLQVKGQCYFNLGQADLVIAIRTPLLSIATDTILSLWENGIDLDSGEFRDGRNNIIRILSSSTICAFPIEKQAGSCDGAAKLYSSLSEWLINESKHSNTLSFEFFYTFSGNAYGITEDVHRIVLGDSDLKSELLEVSEEKCAEIAKKICKVFTYHSMNDGNNMNEYVSSVTLLFFDKNINVLKINADRDKLISLDGEFEKLFSKYSKVAESKEVDESSQVVFSLLSTLRGLYKYVLRLCESCFADDLYAYTERIFKEVLCVANQYFTELNFLTDEFIGHTTSLITELQHLYSVLALSSNTFIETYGSSMRSLNAASTLLTAYQGVLSYLNLKFPATYVDGQEKIKSQHAILMIPYRMAQSSSIIMYPSFSPSNRLSLIHIDFTQMFHTNYALFMLLHEAGHMLSNHNRAERFPIFCRTVIKQYWEQLVLGKRFSEAGSTFLSIYGNPKKLSGLKKESICALLDKVDKALRKRMKKWIKAKASKECKRFQRQYNSTEICKNCAQAESYFFDAVIPELENFVDNMKNKIWFDRELDDLTQMLIKLYIGKAMKIIKDYKSERCNTRFFAKIRAHYIAPYREYYIKTSLRNSACQVFGDLIYRIADIFQDIHADIFMCKLLGVTADEYAKTLKHFSSRADFAEFYDPCNLIRFSVVFRACFDIKLQKEAFIDYFGFSEEEGKKLIFNLMPRISSSTYMEYYRYAKICCTTMNCEMKAIENDPCIQHIRTIYKASDKEDKFMEALFHMYTKVFDK